MDGKELWEKYVGFELEDAVQGLYISRFGKLPEEGASPKTLFLKLISLYEAIITSLPGSVYWKDEEGKYLGCNKNMLDLLGYKSEEELVGKTDSDFDEELNRPTGWAKEIADDDNRVFETGKPLVNKQEGSFTDSSGRLWAQLTNKVSVISPKDNAVELVLGISIDISDRVKLEDELKEKNKELERIIEKHRQFLQNQEHDLITPCSGLFGAADMILNANENFSDETKYFIRGMAESANAVLKYSNSMLQVLYLHNHDESAVSARLYWKEIVQNVYSIYKASALLKKLDYHLSIDEKIPEYLLGDERRLQGVLLNLMSNAFRFTEKGKVLFSVECLKKEAECIYLRFTIKDTGIGIPKEKQLDIYEAFYKIKPSNRGGERGRGTGLALVKKYVDEMQGELVLNSELGKGSEFRVILPFKISLDQSPPAPVKGAI